jgi:peptidoglycan hydrolase-like protein with peptidoglycan-binding domain
VETKLSDGDTSYTISGVTYYNNGRKQMADGTMVNYTCNDPEFKAKVQVAVSTTGNSVQQAQALLGIPQAEQDGKFGPKTLQALKTKLGIA